MTKILFEKYFFFLFNIDQKHLKLCVFFWKLNIKFNADLQPISTGLTKLRPCVCRKFLAFWLSQYFDLTGILTVETSSVKLPWFWQSKILQNQSKILTKYGKCQKFRYIFNIFDIWWYMLKFDCIFLTFSKNSSLYIHDIHQILTCQKHTQNRTRTLKRRDKPLFVFWPFLVQFRLILGLNNFKFVHKSIFAVYTSIRSNQLDWINLIGSTWSDQLNWINSNQIDCRNGFVDKF